MSIPNSMTAEEIRIEMLDDDHIGMLYELILHGWPSSKAETQKTLQPYHSFRDETAFIDGTAMKGRRIIILTVLQDKVLKQLHINKIGIKNARLLEHKYMYWINMSSDTEETVKNCATCLDFQATCAKDKIKSYEIPGRMSKSVATDIFTIINKQYLCIADYHSKFLLMKQVKGFSADKLINTC